MESRDRNETITGPADVPDAGMKEALSKGQDLHEAYRPGRTAAAFFSSSASTV